MLRPSPRAAETAFAVRVDLFGVDDRARLETAFAVRVPVFVGEQHVPADEEIDDHDRTDPQARHAIVRDETGLPVAAGRYYVLAPDSVQIGRMAVVLAFRRRGVGRRLLDALIDDARARGFRRAVLHAQDHAVGFYAKAGFTPFGATFVECGIVHQPMDRPL
jgi:predicted GNAT family N-acyltransferase